MHDDHNMTAFVYNSTSNKDALDSVAGTAIGTALVAVTSLTSLDMRYAELARNYIPL